MISIDDIYAAVRRAQEYRREVFALRCSPEDFARLVSLTPGGDPTVDALIIPTPAGRVSLLPDLRMQPGMIRAEWPGAYVGPVQ